MEMEIKLFNRKFEALKKYEKKLPGIALGLNVLNQLNALIKIMPVKIKDDEILVDFYDFEAKTIRKLSLIDLNLKLYDLYMSQVFFNRDIDKNILYFKLFSVYDKTYSQYNYGYFNKSNSTRFTMINKFIQGLRKNFSKNFIDKKTNRYIFDLHQIISSFDQNFFDEKVSAEQFYHFWVDFVLELKRTNIIDLDSKNFEFKLEYKQELINIMYFSFELMILGNNNVYDVYDLRNDDVEAYLYKTLIDYNKFTLESLYYINDLLVSLAISCSVLTFCAPKNITNIYVEALIISNQNYK